MVVIQQLASIALMDAQSPFVFLLSPRFFKKAKGILLLPSSANLSVRPSVMSSPPKPLDEIQPNLVCEILT